MKTIEIEKKVRLEPHHIQKITQKALFIKESRIQDSYFDTADYRYTVQNIWLRQREGVFELKIGIKKQNGSLDRYEEMTDEKSILKHLGIDIFLDLPTALSQNEFSCFCHFATHRKSYQLGALKIDIDEADFGDLHYRVAEIEVVVSNLDKVQEAEQKIAQFIKEMGIDTSIQVPAKLTYYLYFKKPKHYQILVQNQIIQPIIMDCLHINKNY
jgi:adenylate cyclase class IV